MHNAEPMPKTAHHACRMKLAVDSVQDTVWEAIHYIQSVWQPMKTDQAPIPLTPALCGTIQLAPLATKQPHATNVVLRPTVVGARSTIKFMVLASAQKAMLVTHMMLIDA